MRLIKSLEASKFQVLAFEIDKIIKKKQRSSDVLECEEVKTKFNELYEKMVIKMNKINSDKKRESNA